MTTLIPVALFLYVIFRERNQPAKQCANAWIIEKLLSKGLAAFAAAAVQVFSPPDKYWRTRLSSGDWSHVQFVDSFYATSSPDLSNRSFSITAIQQLAFWYVVQYPLKYFPCRLRLVEDNGDKRLIVRRFSNLRQTPFSIRRTVKTVNTLLCCLILALGCLNVLTKRPAGSGLVCESASPNDIHLAKMIKLVSPCTDIGTTHSPATGTISHGFWSSNQLK